MIAGARNLAVTSSGGKAVTEASTCFVTDYLNNANPAIQGQTWRLIDTPGSADTAGIKTDIHNQKIMTDFVKQTGRVDAVFLVWKAEERLSPEIMDAVVKMRLAYGPKVWRRFVMVYTFQKWTKPSFFGSV